MNYDIKVKELTINKNSMILNISGVINDKRINSHFASKPKLILHFINEWEDRRIPFVISNVIYTEGKCYFSGRYKYNLNLVFWKTRKEFLPFNLRINFIFIDYYEEAIQLNFEKDSINTDDLKYKFAKSDFSCSFTPDKKEIMQSPIKRGLVKFTYSIVKSIRYIFAIVMLPLFFIDGLLHLTKVLPMPAKFCDENPLKRFLAYIFSKFSSVAGCKVSLWTGKRWIFKRFFDLFKILKIKENKITFISLRRDEISGNFAFVYDKIKDDKNLDIHFILNEHTITEMSIKEIIEFTKACATSKIIILDEYTPMIHYIDLRKETKLIQLWHACGAFKTFGFSRLAKPKGSKQSTRNHRSYDYSIVSSEYCRKFHAEGFGIPTNNVAATGIPRTDIFFDEEYKNKTRKAFYKEHPEFKDKKIIIFAPTFRGMEKETAFYPTDLFDVGTVCENIPDDYVIIIKHHPFVKDVHPIPKKYSNRVIDFSEQTEINDLLFIADLIITDYSSLIFEASLMNIPMIFYVFDLEKYINDRDFYFDFKEYIPGKIAYSLDDVIKAINNNDFCKERLAPFAKMFFDHRDGKSTDRVVKLLYDTLRNPEIIREKTNMFQNITEGNITIKEI